MARFLGYFRAVLWGLIGLGGRRTDAETRVDEAGFVSIVVIGLVLVLLLVTGLIGLAKLAAGG